MTTTDSHHQDIAPPWQTLLHRVCPLRFPIPWLTAALVMMILAGAVCFYAEKSFRQLPRLVVAAILIAAESNAVILFHKMLTLGVLPGLRPILRIDPSNFPEWKTAQAKPVFSFLPNLVLGVILGAVVLSVSIPGEGTYASTLGKAFHGALFFLIGVTGGSMLYVLLALALVCYRLGKSDLLMVSVFQTRTSRIQVIPQFMMRVCYITVGVYVLGICIIPLGHHAPGPLQMGIPAAFGVFVVVYFIASQIGIHHAIREAKGRKLDALVPQIEKAFDAVAQDPSGENVSRLRELFNLQNTINGKPVWGFGSRELLALLGSIIVPLLICLLQWILGTR